MPRVASTQCDVKTLQSSELLADMPNPQRIRSMVPPAFLLKCRLQAEGGRWVDCSVLLDTGSGLDFIVLYDGSAPFLYAGEGACNVRVRLADGSACAVTRWVSCNMQIAQGKEWSPAFVRRFHVIPAYRKAPSCAPAEPVFLIAGRSFLRDFHVTVVGGEGKVLIPGPAPELPSGPSLCLISAVGSGDEAFETGLFVLEDADDLSPSGNDRLLLDAAPTDQEIIHIPFSSSPVLCDNLLRTITARSWVPMRYCPHWLARLRALERDEPRDDPEQGYVFELMCDNLAERRPVSPPDSAIRFSKTAYERLNVTQQQAFDDIVKDYEDRGWWVPTDEKKLRAASEHVLDPAVVFMVPGGAKRRDRLVVDLRRANKRFVKGSGAATTVPLCIAVARLYGSGVCWVFDAAKAFYKLRWVGLLAVLIVRGLLYSSRRCIFGVTTGPGSLRHTMGTLVDDFRTVVKVLMVILCFADDVFCAGLQGAMAVCYLIWLLTICGFCITRKKFQCMAMPENRLSVEQQLAAQGLPKDLFPWSDSVDLLGCTLSYSGGSDPLLVASCNRHDRLRSAREQATRLAECLRSTDGAGVSKAFIFSLGGNLSYDCLGCHPVDRVVADSLRSWFARVFASQSWSAACDLGGLDEVGSATARCLADWILELTESPAECCHETPVRQEGDPIRLEVASDASTTGAGYVIAIVVNNHSAESPRRFVLGSGAWRFTTQQRHYHSNRRELAACCRAVQATVDIISQLADTITGGLPPLELVICSDNKPTVAWLQGRGSISRSSLERRAVIRTLNALKDELDHLKSLTRGQVSVRHIAGQENVLPDTLSRLFDRVIVLPSGRRISLADALHGDPDDVAGCPDLFEDPQSQAIGVSWLFQEEKREEPQRMPGSPVQLEECNVMEVDAGDEDLVAILAALPEGDVIMGSYLLADPKDEEGGGIIQHLCGENWDINGVSSDFLFLRTVFNALRPPAKRKACDALEDSNEDALVRSLQADMKQLPVRPAGPFVYDTEREVYVFRNGTADGGCSLLPVVPSGGRGCGSFRTKLLFDAHRASRHSTLASTVSHVYERFFVPNLRAEARRFMKSCFACQLLRARRSWDQLPGNGPDRIRALAWEPYREVFIDVLALGDIRGYQGTTKVLTVYCLHTFHSCWVPTGESMTDIIAGLNRVQTEQGGLGLIWCDQASYFRSSRFAAEVFRSLGARTRLLPVRSPWKSGGGERAHGLGLRIAKMLLRGQAGYVGRKRSGKVPRVDLEEICREVTFLLNTRPLDFSNSNEPSGECIVATPDLLAKGFTRKRGCLLPPPSTSVPITRRLKAARTYFLSNVFRDMRLAVAKSIGWASTRGKVLPIVAGSPVLVYHPEKKLSPGFRLAHVMDVLKDGRLIRVKFVDGSEAEQHHFNVVPLLHHPELSQQRGRIMD